MFDKIFHLFSSNLFVLIYAWIGCIQCVMFRFPEPRT